ncbi:TRAP transporter substrate-binding protein [Pusillimonas sp. CC-YST705]|uniref:TRAP transporter substrate-binding protein n=1 Tax=Mesopusillimonas faecipullorum TaxID=2755040 RepID=A0ABS8CE08_9BURK|nr:TRAP transporter substrate-binding protein [Mesopusillimonas faecipullorum]MCB5364276.1 TRAP transporter substrate-binding protein [Mesopusillimonas faecipullorum]
MLKKMLISAGLIAAATFSSLASAQTVLRFSNWLPPTHPITTQILQPWAAQIEDTTAGRVKVQFLPALGRPPAHFDLVRDGVADMALSVHAYTADRFPSSYGMTLPGYADDAESAAVAYWRTHQKHFAPLDEFKGVHLVGLYTHGPGHFYTREAKPVAKLDDLKGMRLRATGGIVQDISTRLGVVPQFASASEAYELLSRGVVDGAMFNADSVDSFRLLPLMKNAYQVPGGLYRDTHYLIINNNAYAKLSDEDRKAFDAASGEAFARLAGKAWDKVDAEAWEKMKAAGYEVVVASDDDLARIRAEGDALRDDWLARMQKLGVDGQAALEMFKEEIAKVEAEK